jgi:hypothetical protein
MVVGTGLTLIAEGRDEKMGEKFGRRGETKCRGEECGTKMK